jgi:carbamoyltransferase
VNEYLYILGVPNFANYEATAALIRVPRRGGAIDYVTVAEERLARSKHAYDFPLRGIDYCLQAFGLESLDQVDFVYTDYARVPRWLNSGPGYRKLEHDYLKLRLNLSRDRIRVIDHHDAHAASAFYPSGFDDAAVLVVDALGSRLNTQTLYHFRRRPAAGRPSRLHDEGRRGPARFDEGDGLQAGEYTGQQHVEVTVVERGDHWGIGRLYSLVTGSVLPYGPEKGFGKTMGLAPYGRQLPGPVLEFNPRDEGMTTDYSAFCTRAPVSRIVAADVRRCEDREAVLDPYFARAAYDVQQECERQMVRMARYAYERTGARNICIAGGVGLNGLSNARILSDTPFENIWITPGCSDTGISLGLALWGYFQDIADANSPPVSVSMTTAYTGRNYPVQEIVTLLEEHGIECERVAPEAIAGLVASGKIIGWFEGGSEFGPRALGHRSIVADPRDPEMKDTLNRRVKFREAYRPYAPSILAEHAAEWLHLDGPSPFMLLVVDVREEKRALIPAVTHVDHTTRPQTVTEAANPNYYRMIREFHRLTGVPMVLNTSLNINREPIVETPLDLLICAFGTAIDYVYAEGLLIDASRYASPELVKRLTAARSEKLAAQWTRLTTTLLTSYDIAERDAYLAEENRIAEWHREYRAKYELENRIAGWLSAGSAIVIAGTRGHTRCLYDYIADFARLRVRAFVPLDEHPGERGELDAYDEATLETVDWAGVDAVLVSTHEYQEPLASLLRSATPPGIEIITLYDDAGDTLLHVLPGRWPVVAPTAGPQPAPVRTAISVGALDMDAPEVPRGTTERYALIVNYHYCHPPDSFLHGTNTVTPDQFDAQLRVLRQNFVCTTIGELTNPEARLPETVAVVTFDDGLKDVAEHALPILQRWGVPATVFCSSAPLIDGRLLNVHRGHLLQARLGATRFREEFERALAACGPLELDSPERLGLRNLHVYDDPATRRFKTRLNFEVPYPVLDTILQRLSETFLGSDDELAPQVYMTSADLRRCQDAGLEIGAHGHRHRVLARLDEDEQRAEIASAADYFRTEFGLSAMPWSYPWGFAGTWNDTTKRLLADAGFLSGTTMIRAIVKPADLHSRWEIPRFDVKDVFDERGNLQAERLRALFTAD